MALDSSVHSLTSRLRAMPKVDIHRHLEGSLRLETLAQISLEHELNLPNTPAELASIIQVTDTDPKTPENFLAKFKLLRRFFRSMDIIRRLVSEVIADAAEDGVVYLELLFTPQALASEQGSDLESVFDVVLESSQAASGFFPIQVNLIASINRHEPLAIAKRVVQLALERREDGLVGLDLAGDESQFGAEPFKRLLMEAVQGGLRLTVHAGEWGGPENVRFAVEEIGAQRIGHGVRMLEDQAVLELVRGLNVPCEVCLTSNRLTGVDNTLPDQPLKKLLQAGLQVTLNSDDPTILRTTLSQELAIAILDHGFSVESLKGMTLAAAQAAFLDRTEKRALEDRLLARLMEFELEAGRD